MRLVHWCKALTYEFTGPSALVLKDSSGVTVGCKSACLANVDGNPCMFFPLSQSHAPPLNELPHLANSPNCCSGSYNTPQTCPASGVSYYHYFSESSIREFLPPPFLLLKGLQRINARTRTRTLSMRAAEPPCGLATLTLHQTTPSCFALRFQVWLRLTHQCTMCLYFF